MLKSAPGREEEARYWLAALSVNRAIMHAIDASESPCSTGRHFPGAINRRDSQSNPDTNGG